MRSNGGYERTSYRNRSPSVARSLSQQAAVCRDPRGQPCRTSILKNNLKSTRCFSFGLCTNSHVSFFRSDSSLLWMKDFLRPSMVYDRSSPNAAAFNAKAITASSIIWAPLVEPAKHSLPVFVSFPIMKSRDYRRFCTPVRIAYCTDLR